MRKIGLLHIIFTFVCLAAAIHWGCTANEDTCEELQAGDAGADTDTDVDGDADTDADSDTDTDSDSDADSDTDTDSDSDADSDTDTDSDSDADTDADTDGDTDSDTVPDVLAIVVTPSFVLSPNGCGTYQLYAACFRRDNTAGPCTRQVTWRSSNTKVAEVSNEAGEEGKVAVASTGRADITAEADGVVSTPAEVWVDVGYKCDRIDIGPLENACGLSAGDDPLPLMAECVDECQDSVYPFTGAVEWSTSDTDVAEVSNDPNTTGEVTPIGAGTAFISANHQGSISATQSNRFRLTVTEPDSDSDTL